MKPRHGMVIGKFYPPHAGHHLLVRTAASLCERVSVVVMAATAETIPLEARVRWLREVHRTDPNVRVTGVRDDHPVDYESDPIWRAHIALMLEGVAQLGAGAGASSASAGLEGSAEYEGWTVDPGPIDAVFTSEDYGAELGERLGARHVDVDPLRLLVPTSGTAVRQSPEQTWDYLAPPVRGGLARRIVVVGAESTGKTTLASELAARLRQRGRALGLTRWVPEYGREHTALLLACQRGQAQLDGKPPPSLEELVWPSEAFLAIAREQNRLEDREARSGGPVLICDTDAFATGIWHERYVGQRSAAVDALARHHPLYLLTHDEDVPFAQDGLRDGERIRHWMTQRFVERLEASGRRWCWIRGPREQRLAQAERAVDALLAEGWGLG